MAGGVTDMVFYICHESARGIELPEPPTWSAACANRRGAAGEPSAHW